MVDAVPQAVGHGPLGEQRGPAPTDVLEDRGRPHDVQVRVLLAREGGRRQVLCRRARSDGVGGLLAETSEREADRRRQIVRDGDPLEGPADLRADRADPLPVFRVQARQPIEPIVDRRGIRHDPPEGVRRHAEAKRHADAFEPRKLPQVRALAANDRDLCLVDLLKTQHVAVGLDGVDSLRTASTDLHRMLLRTHRVAPFVACGEPVWSTPRGLKQAPPAAILWVWRGALTGLHAALGELAARRWEIRDDLLQALERSRLHVRDCLPCPDTWRHVRPSASTAGTACAGAAGAVRRRAGSARPVIAPARDRPAETPIAGANPSLNACAEA